MKYFFLISALLFGSITSAFSQGNGNCSVCCPLDVDSYADCVDFEDYTEGPLVPQASPKFTLFSFFSEDAYVTNFPTGTDNQCVYFDGYSDVKYNINRDLTDDIAARLEWKLNMSNSKGAYVALVTDDPLAPPIEILLDNLVATVSTHRNNEKIEIAQFDYQADVWTTLLVITDPKRDIIELWMDSTFICKVTVDLFNRLSYLNFYSDDIPDGNGFYIDDLCYQETNPDIACTLEYNPVCVNNKTYVNACFAYIDGYTECEYYGGECSSSTSETNQVAPVFYPNPNRTGHFYTQDQSISYTTLINTNGQSLPIVAQQGDLDLSHLPCGVYFLSGTKDSLPFKVKLVLVE